MGSNGKTVFSLEEFDREMSAERLKSRILRPAFSCHAVTVAIVSSDEYSVFAGVLLASIIANSNPNRYYDIVVLSDDMLIRNINRLESMCADYPNISIRVFDISSYIKGLDFFTWAHFTNNTYYRLLTPDIFRDYNKVIYLDSDIVVNHDIGELYDIDLEDFYVGCALDTHVVSYCTRIPPLEQMHYNKEVLGLTNPAEYFQAGVTVYNINKIKTLFKIGYLLKNATKYKLRWLDQDLINMLFKGHIKRLPNKWNVMVSNIPDNLDEYFLPEDLRKEYFEARANPYIIHYVGKSMPCFTTNPDLYEYFWKYARMTVFYEILLQKQSIDYAEKLKESVLLEYGLKNKGFRYYLNRLFPVGTRRRKILSKLKNKITK